MAAELILGFLPQRISSLEDSGPNIYSLLRTLWSQMTATFEDNFDGGFRIRHKCQTPWGIFQLPPPPETDGELPDLVCYLQDFLKFNGCELLVYLDPRENEFVFVSQEVFAALLEYPTDQYLVENGEYSYGLYHPEIAGTLFWISHHIREVHRFKFGHPDDEFAENCHYQLSKQLPDNVL